jgi:arginyl-tRNA--protein-N-Asp/Glu arginylyltransferase
MFAQVHFPQSLKPSELDHYLSMGWFRMGQSIFTTNFLNFKSRFYSAIWLRMALHEFSPDKAQGRLKKMNEKFRVEINPASVTLEKELLFARYKNNVSFEASASLNQLLYGKTDLNIYNTYEVDIFDEEKLIAVGFFDIGKDSAAGISSFYDPDYKKYSLGKYLILYKIEYCKKNNLKYFYPGYFVPGYAAFDYKLQLSRNGMEYFQLHSEEWVSIDAISVLPAPIDDMIAKINVLQNVFNQYGIKNKIYKYEFFDANLIPDLSGLELFDTPLFLAYNFLADDDIGPVVIYDVCSREYHLVKCRSVWPSKFQNELDDVFCAHLLKIEEYLFSSVDQADFVSALLDSIKFKIG